MAAGVTIMEADFPRFLNCSRRLPTSFYRPPI
jgi:hypothetical protein